ncbi:MAG: B12-binding domain-containing radical SAM protein [Promethearchaeota archaeon]
MNTKILDILLIFPSGGDVYHTNFNHHLGTAYIVAYLREHGFLTEQFISNKPYNIKECVKTILQYKPKVIGFSVYESNFMQSVLISNCLKESNPKCIIIFGGPTPTVQSEQILKSISSVDICVRQEGEETILKILTELASVNFNLKQVDLLEIKGITFRDKDRIIINPDCNVLYMNRDIKNYIDRYPSPYISNIIPISKAFPTGIITARGCNQNCTYCNCAVLSKKNIYFHSIERVIGELSLISKLKKFSQPIPIYDDTFTIIPSRTKRICKAIIESDIKIPLLCITRCDKLDEELLDLMKLAGFVSIGFSLESAVPRVLRAIGKVRSVDVGDTLNYEKEIEFIQKLKYMTHYAKKIGMFPVFVSIMIGLPGETPQDAKKTLNLINQLEIDYYTHNILHIFKGTPLYKNHRRYGYKLTPMGYNNQIILRNNFPFNIDEIGLAKKSTKERNSKVMDYNILNILSLKCNQSNNKSFFNNIIINQDVIEPSLVKWMQQVLAINGIIVHIYSNKDIFLKLHTKNEMTLYNEYSPTNVYECYYWENSGNIKRLISGRMLSYGEEAGLSISLRNTNLVLEEYYKGYDTDFFIGVDRNKTDTDSFLKLLHVISKSEDSFNYLLERNVLPQFQSLCRWTMNQANCEDMETAIIENDNTVRICWYSEPLGKVGMSFFDIKRNLTERKRNTIKRRRCHQCEQKNLCQKCIFPFPLSAKEYCEYKITQKTNESANLINTFYVLKDFLYKPINPYDF